MALGIRRARLAVGAVLLAALAAMALASTASASPLDPSGVIHPVKRMRLGANHSNNWFGYNQGSLQQGGKLFNSITAKWTVPTARQHAKGRAGDSATWIGIGGGCMDAGCNLTDPTLIQTGTEQDVGRRGKASYSAWWELVPVPAVTIPGMKISHGDRMYAAVTEMAPDSEIWTITVKDLTRKESFSHTVPYASTHGSAEWIEETPVAISTAGAGLATLPKLTEVPFHNATVNGVNADLKASEKMDLINGSGKVIATPSKPNAKHNGFGACAWRTTCRVPRR